MKLIKKIFRKQELDLEGKCIFREAVRGVIIKDKKLLMIYSTVNGDYKFPGGGVEVGETYEEALVREIKEESGATIIKIEKEFGKVIEYDEPLEQEYQLFKMVSYYYICRVDDTLGDQELDLYEEELGFKPIWVDIDCAIATNKEVVNSQKEPPRWTLREISVLELIKEEIVYSRI